MYNRCGVSPGWMRESGVPHVFISYVRQNQDVVDRLAQELTSRGVTVWLDRNDIEPGARWQEAVKRAIESGKFFLACFSKEYNERSKTYMNEELTLAIDELRKIASDKTWFIPVLINETDIPSRRISAVEDLRDLNAVKLYENWDEGIRRILRVLQYDDPAYARVWHLLDMLGGPFPDDRAHASKELGDLRPKEKMVIAALIKAAKDDSAEVRGAALGALGKIGPAAGDAVQVLAAALADSNEHVRERAVVALESIGPAAVDTVPALAAALKDRGTDVGIHAALALGNIGPAAAAAVPALAVALEDPREDIAGRAAVALGKIGPAATEAIPALLRAALTGSDENVWWRAAAALGKIEPAAVLPGLVAALNDPEKSVRQRAADALGHMGQAASDAAPALAAALNDSEQCVRTTVADALQRVR
jgi:HEAT repeat protein